MTEKEAAMWTDGRYYLQAADQLDSNWTLMKQGQCYRVAKVEIWQKLGILCA